MDSKYEISSTAAKVVNTGVVKAKEFDEKVHLSETVVTVSASIASSVKAADEKYKISETTGVSYVRVFDSYAVY